MVAVHAEHIFMHVLNPVYWLNNHAVMIYRRSCHASLSWEASGENQSIITRTKRGSPETHTGTNWKHHKQTTERQLHLQMYEKLTTSTIKF